MMGINTLILLREGDIKEINFENDNLNNINLNNILNYEHSDIIELNSCIYKNNFYKIYGSNNQYILKENKHELFYPLNQSIYYGDIIIFKLDINNNILNLKIEEYINIIN